MMSSTGKPSDKQNAIVQEVSESNSPFISGSTLMHMLFYTFLMVTVPISSYFVMKDFIFQRLIGGSEDDSIVPSALTAVVMVHVVLALFVYSAFNEKIPQKKKQE